MGLLDAPSVPPTAVGLQALETKRATALRTFHLALANRENALCKVLCVGDSMTEGQGATLQVNRYPNRLRYLLRSRFPTTGITASPATDYVPSVYSGSSGFDIQFAWTGGTPSANTNVGLKKNAGQLSSTLTAVTFTVTGTSADIYWFRTGSGGTFSWAIDGGSATNVSTAGAGLSGSKTTVTLGTSASHTLTLSYVSGTSIVIEGVVVYDGDTTKSVKVYEGGHFGWTSTNWATGSNGVTNWRQAVSAIAPHLMVLRLGANDYNTSIPVSTFTTNLQTLIDTVIADAGTPAPSIVLVADTERAAPASPVAPWSSYVAAVYQLAAQYSNVIAFDATLRFPRQADDVWSLYADTVHHNNKGHGLFADTLAAFIAPR